MANIKDQFLNPESMLTPGLAGALTMMISSTLWVQFGCPQKDVALTISFCFGLLVLAGKSMQWWYRLVLYALNSLFIFSMAMGSHQALEKPTLSPGVKPVGWLSPFDLFATSASAGTPEVGSTTNPALLSKSPAHGMTLAQPPPGTDSNDKELSITQIDDLRLETIRLMRERDSLKSKIAEHEQQLMTVRSENVALKEHFKQLQQTLSEHALMPINAQPSNLPKGKRSFFDPW